MKPLLLLDIDGVLVPFDPVEPYVMHSPTIWLAEYNTVALRALQHDYEIVWASWWEETSSDLYPLMEGVGPFPHINFSEASLMPGVPPKVTAIEAYIGDRPCVWIDDEICETTTMWATDRSERGIPTVCIKTQSNTGATPAEWLVIAALADALGP